MAKAEAIRLARAEVLIVADQGVEEAAERLRDGGVVVTALQADLSTFDGNDGVAAAIQRVAGR